MMTVTFYAPTVDGRTIQKLVGEYGGRFKCNPFQTFSGNSCFTIDFGEGSNYNRFSACMRIVKEPFF